MSPLLPILKNGYRHTEGKGRQITVTEKCAFDSLFQIFVALYADNVHFKSLIESSDNEFANLIKLAMNGRIIEDTLKARSELLLKYYRKYCDENDAKSKTKKNKITSQFFEKNTKRMLNLNCNISIHSMLKMITDNMEELNSVEQLLVCDNCSEVHGKKQLVNVPIIARDSTSEKIMCYPSKQSSKNTCSHCEGPMSFLRKPNHFVIVDTESLSKAFEHSITVDIYSVQPEICYNEKKFSLKAIVEIRGSDHFIAHVKRGKISWESFDDVNPHRTRNSPSIMEANLFFLRNCRWRD